MIFSGLRVLIALAVIAMTGCASTPLVSGDSLVQAKRFNFPKAGQLVHVTKGGTVHLHAEYNSGYGYTLAEPVSLRFQLGRISVTTDEVLYKASLQDAPVMCTQSRTFFDLLAGPWKISCFSEGAEGVLTHVKAAPGAIWFTKELDKPVKYISKEFSQPIDGKVMKREVVFDGHSNGKIFFIERQYERSLDEASRARPFVVSVGGIPAKVIVLGVGLNVSALSETTMTYSVDKSN